MDWSEIGSVLVGLCGSVFSLAGWGWLLYMLLRRGSAKRELRDYRKRDPAVLWDAFLPGTQPQEPTLPLEFDLGGYRVTLGQARAGALTVSIEVPHAVGEFSVSPVGLVREVGRALGLFNEATPNRARARNRYAVTSRTAGSVRRLFETPELDPYLDRLFGARFGVKQVELQEGRLRAEIPRSYVTGAPSLGPVPDLSPERVEAALRCLLEVARLCSRRVIAVAEKEAPRFGWIGGQDDRIRCPYCHDSLDTDQEALTPCPSCHTVHHQDCFQEAGGCTVLGCGARPTRLPSRESD